MEAEQMKVLAQRGSKANRRTDLKDNATCKICGAGFYASPGHKDRGWGSYCSMACRSVGTGGENHPNWKQGEGVLPCKGCGNEFRQKPGLIGTKRQRAFCSADCRRQYQKVSLTCSACGVEYEIAKSLSAKRTVCSRKCGTSANAKRTNLTCIECHKPFYRKPSEITRAKGGGSFCSMECKAKRMSQTTLTTSGVTRNVKGGKRADLGNRYFRSGWEANYARYLDWLIAQRQIRGWEFEPQTFEFPVKKGSKFYTPDFRITNNDGSTEYHEVKGWMDQKSRTKLKRMGIHYPDVKVVLIDSAYYRSLEKTIAPSIAGWERRRR